jgi:hypothetical protein
MIRIGMILGFLIFLTLTSCNSDERHNLQRHSKEGLVVTHTPLNISDVPKELIQKMDFPYVRFYRTEVSNKADVPIKIIWFDGYFAQNGHWIASNVRNKVLRSTDFLDWYSHDDISADGWLRPGGKAICSVNWHWTDTPEDIQSKWAYIGVDAQGNDYFAEAVVPTIKPEKLQ